MKTAKEIQLAFFTKIKSSLPAHVSFVDELADLLNTSHDSAYRRLRGDTLLGLDELLMLSRHFKVTFDTDANATGDHVVFSHKRLRKTENGFDNWLQLMSTDVKKIASVPGSSILYASDDVPPWHHFTNDELICFKIFYWQKSILGTPALQQANFDPALIDPGLIQQAKGILQDYNQIVSTEIWTEDTLNSTLKQIEYFWESGFFKDQATAFRMCDHIEEEMDLLKVKAERQSKLINTDGGTTNFTLYQSEVMVGTNSILVTMGNHKIAYVSNNTFNMMSTVDSGFVEESELWLKNLMHKSILISGINEKQRNRFFKVLKEKIDILRSRIK